MVNREKLRILEGCQEGISKVCAAVGKITTALACLVPQPRFTFCGLGSLALNIAPDFQGQ